MVIRQSSLWLGTDEMPTKEQQTRGVWSLNSQVLESLLQDWALSYSTGDNTKGGGDDEEGKEGRKEERKQEKAAAQFGGAVQNRPFYKLTQQL